MTPRPTSLRPASRRGAAGILAALGLMLTAGTTACGPSAPTTAAAPAVSAKLTGSLPDQLSIGVVVSVTSAPGEGTEWRDAAEGAQVAAERFALAGEKVTLVPANDKGTSEGAVAAVKSLAGRKVAGIVLATAGRHIDGALQEAAQLDVPVLLPYAGSAANLATDAGWLTGPSAASADQRLVELLRDRKLTRPLLIDAGGGSVTGLSPAEHQDFQPDDDPAALAKSLAARRHQHGSDRNEGFDAIVVSGPAEMQGRVVSALQGAPLGVPILLTDDALSPAFPTALVSAGGSLSGELLSAGLDHGDGRALEPTEAGRALAGYFAALNLLAADSKATDLFGERPFGDVAAAADVRSHDAVVCFVRAAETAKSTDPAQVERALAGRSLGYPDGLSGTPLNLSAPEAVADDAVVALAATADSPGLRPASTASADSSGGDSGAALYWYPAKPG